MTIDGNVSGMNRPVFEVLQKVKNPKEMTVDEAKSLRTAVMKDGKIDAAELDLLQELTQDQNQTIKISAEPDFKAQALVFGAAKGPAKETINALAKPGNMNNYWDGGQEGMLKLIDMYSIGPATANRVSNFVGGKLLESWQKSSVFNAYAPVIGTLVKAYDVAKNADPETLANARNMLYDSMRLVDEHVGGMLPDFLYTWLKNGEQPPQV